VLHEAVPDLGCCIHARLGPRERAAGTTLDQVAGDGERAADEADDRLLRREGRAYERNRLEHRGGVPLRVEATQPDEVVSRANRLVDHRAHALDEIDPEAHGGDRQHDVGVDDRRVDAVGADGLERHLRAELGPGADLEQRIPLANRPVFGQRAARLAHEPDRRTLHGVASRRANE
jgi:hypothetical protein